MRKLLSSSPPPPPRRLHHSASAAETADQPQARPRRPVAPAPPTGRRSAASASTPPAWTAASSRATISTASPTATGPDHRDPRRPLQLRHVHHARRPVATAHPRDPRGGGARRPGSQDRRFLRELHGRGRGQRRRASRRCGRCWSGSRRSANRAELGRPRPAGCSARASPRRSAATSTSDDTQSRRDDRAADPGGLGLPDRDYYLSERRRPGPEARPPISAYLAQLLTLAGEPNADARAAAVLAFERRHRRGALDPGREPRRRARPTIAGRAPISRATRPGFDWTRYFQRDRRRRPAQLPRLAAERLHRHRRAIVSRDAARGAQGLSAAPPRSTTAAPYLSQPFRRRQFRLPRHRPQRHAAEPGALEARRRPGHRRDRRGRRPDLCRSAISRPRPRRAADELVRNVIAAMDRRLAEPDLDGARDQGAGARQARRLHPEDRLSRQLARLFERSRISRGDLLGNVIRADRVRISAQPRTSSAGRSTAANGA